jgi:allophanate hydrolase
VAVPENEFGSFVAAGPPPLAIGNARLENGETVKCFLCGPYALSGATEITQIGGWCALIQSILKSTRNSSKAIQSTWGIITSIPMCRRSSPMR